MSLMFVETSSNGDGIIFHIKGTTLQGMTFETKDSRPDLFVSFVKGHKKYIGEVEAADMARFRAVCESITPPGC